jgi:hypothetical protein
MVSGIESLPRVHLRQLSTKTNVTTMTMSEYIIYSRTCNSTLKRNAGTVNLLDTATASIDRVARLAKKATGSVNERVMMMGSLTRIGSFLPIPDRLLQPLPKMSTFLP